jgi:hypothetical protein
MSNPNIATTRSIYLKTSVVKVPFAGGTKTIVKNFNNSNQVLKISSLYISQQGSEEKMPNPLAPNETYTFPWSVQTPPSVADKISGTGGIIGPALTAGALTPQYKEGKWTEVQVTFRRSQGNDITFNLGDGVGSYDLASNLLIKFREVIHAITRDTPVYLGEGDSIEVKVLQGKFSNPTIDGVQVVCSYEKVTNYEDFEVRIGGDGSELGIN